MSWDVEELYQQVIVDHSRRPRNFRTLEGADRSLEGYNPLCGDQLTIYVKLADGGVEDISFQGTGCAISTASASLLTECVKGKSRREVEALFENFRRLVTGQPVPPSASLGKLAAFNRLSEYPTRVKCATLAWHTLRAALDGDRQPVSTE